MRVLWNSRLKCSGYLPKSFSPACDRALRFIAHSGSSRVSCRARRGVLKDIAGNLSVAISILIVVILKKIRDCHAPKQRQSKEHHKDLPRSLEG